MRKHEDRLRNRLFRWIGVMPLDDFDWYANDVMGVLESFEKFTFSSSRFNAVVSKKLGLGEFNKIKDDVEEPDMRDIYQ